MLRAPYDGLWTDYAGNPDRRPRFLIRQDPRIDEAIGEMFALPSKRPRTRPCGDDDVVGLIEILAIVGRIGVVEDLFAAGSADPSRHQAAFGNQIDFRQLLRHAKRISQRRQRIAQQHDANLLGNSRENGDFDVHHRTHAERGAMMFVEHHAIEAHLLGIDRFVEVFVVQPRPDFAIEKAIWNSEETPVFDYLVLRNFTVRTFGEIHYMHGLSPSGSRYSPAQARNSLISLTNSADRSISGRWPQSSKIVSRVSVFLSAC